MLLTYLFSASVLAKPISHGVFKSPKYIAPIQTSHFAAESGDMTGWAWNNIHYNTGAQVLTGDVNVYYIYYGDFTDSQKDILEHFAENVGESDWYKTTRQYYYQENKNAEKVYVNGAVKLAGTVHDNYSKGKNLKGNDLPDLIQKHIDSNALPEDTSAVYFVLTSADVKEAIRDDLGKAAFCSSYCGYHVSWKLKSGKRIFYSQVGNPLSCMNGCAPSQNRQTSPNGDAGVDAMISVIAHELTEAVSDPWSDGERAWEDGSGYENADKCAYKYGTVNKAETAGFYNTQVGDLKFLIQQNWSPVSQKCVTTL